MNKTILKFELLLFSYKLISAEFPSKIRNEFSGENFSPKMKSYLKDLEIKSPLIKPKVSNARLK